MLSLLLFDEGLSFNLPDLRAVLLQYLRPFKVETCEVYSQIEFIDKSMQSCCAFLLESDEMVCLFVCFFCHFTLISFIDLCRCVDIKCCSAVVGRAADGAGRTC